MNLDYYIERNLLSKRFIISLLIIGYFLATSHGEALVGAVTGFYFGEKANANKAEQRRHGN